MASLEKIIGHRRQLSVLSHSLKGIRIPTGYLFAGLNGIGKSKVAKTLAQSLLCENPVSSEMLPACGVCGSCHRIFGGNSESVLWIATDDLQMKLEDVQPIHQFLNLRAISKYRIVILDQAQKLNPSAANSILKVLEEPPPDVLFIFISPSPQQILPTLLSRLQMILFYPLSVDQLKELGDFPDWALRASQGSVERLLQMNDPQQTKYRLHAFSDFRRWMEDPQSIKDPLVRDTFKDRDSLMDLSKYFLSFLRDLSVLQGGPGAASDTTSVESQLLNPDLTKELLSVSAEAKPDVISLRDRIQKVFQWEQSLQSTRDPLMATEILFLN